MKKTGKLQNYVIKFTFGQNIKAETGTTWNDFFERVVHYGWPGQTNLLQVFRQVFWPNHRKICGCHNNVKHDGDTTDVSKFS